MAGIRKVAAAGSSKAAASGQAASSQLAGLVASWGSDHFRFGVYPDGGISVDVDINASEAKRMKARGEQSERRERRERRERSDAQKSGREFRQTCLRNFCLISARGSQFLKYNFLKWLVHRIFGSTVL